MVKRKKEKKKLTPKTKQNKTISLIPKKKDIKIIKKRKPVA